MAAAQFEALLASGESGSLGEIVRREGMKKSSYVIRMLRLACLAPDIIKSILNGDQPVNLTLDYLFRLPSIPLSWPEQRDLLGFDAPAQP